MSPALVPFLVIGFFVAMIALVGWVTARQSKLAAANVRQLAATLGLQVEEKPPALGLFFQAARAAGQLRGKRVELFTYATGSGKSRAQWCAVSAALATGGGLTFHLQRQGISSRLMELFGAREIQVGDAEFDAAWFIQTNQPEYFREALLPELRVKINALVRELGARSPGMEFKLDQGVVRYAEMGSFASGEICQRCQRAAEIVCDFADLAEVFTDQKTGN
jgi:hypothetical protein